MNNFFAAPTDEWGDNAVRLTGAGILTVAAVIIALIIIALFVRRAQAKERSARLTTRQLVFSAAALALAMVTSMIKLFEMPMGGSVTAFKHVIYCFNRILVRSLRGNHDRNGLRITAVCPGTHFLYHPADAGRLPTFIWSARTCRFLLSKETRSDHRLSGWRTGKIFLRLSLRRYFLRLLCSHRDGHRRLFTGLQRFLSRRRSRHHACHSCFPADLRSIEACKTDGDRSLNPKTVRKPYHSRTVFSILTRYII